MSAGTVSPLVILSNRMPLPGGSGCRMRPVRTPECRPWPFTTTPRPIVRCGSRRARARFGWLGVPAGTAGGWPPPALVGPAADDAQECIELERFLQEVEGAVADHAHGGLDRSMSRDHNDR